MRTDVIDECVTIMMNTKDFCGNIQEAFSDMKAEYNLTKEEMGEIARKANVEWHTWQAKAGVKKKYWHYNHFNRQQIIAEQRILDQKNDYQLIAHLI